MPCRHNSFLLPCGNQQKNGSAHLAIALAFQVRHHGERGPEWDANRVERPSKLSFGGAMDSDDGPLPCQLGHLSPLEAADLPRPHVQASHHPASQPAPRTGKCLKFQNGIQRNAPIKSAHKSLEYFASPSLKNTPAQVSDCWYGAQHPVHIGHSSLILPFMCCPANIFF